MNHSLLPHHAYANQVYWEVPAVTDDRQTMPHPILTEARQLAPNQILMTYDQPTDLASATNISNYWIRSNMIDRTDISSVGMGDALTRANTIRPEMGMITAIDNSKMRFLITFRATAIMGVLYIVLPCFVNLEGKTGYTGENWGPLSRNMFIGI